MIAYVQTGAGKSFTMAGPPGGNTHGVPMELAGLAEHSVASQIKSSQDLLPGVHRAARDGAVLPG